MLHRVAHPRIFVAMLHGENENISVAFWVTDKLLLARHSWYRVLVYLEPYPTLLRTEKRFFFSTYSWATSQQAKLMLIFGFSISLWISLFILKFTYRHRWVKTSKIWTWMWVKNHSIDSKYEILRCSMQSNLWFL